MFNASQISNTIANNTKYYSNDNNIKKRERTQNWNQEEKERLLELCRNDVQIIENKRYDARHTEAKSKVWNLIHANFSKQFGTERSVNRLKEQWRRMKAAARSEMQEYKKRIQQFGKTSTESRKPTEFTHKVCDLLDQASRVCEMEIPLKTEYLSQMKENAETIEAKIVDNLPGQENNTGQFMNCTEEQKLESRKLTSTPIPLKNLNEKDSKQKWQTDGNIDHLNLDDLSEIDDESDDSSLKEYGKNHRKREEFTNIKHSSNLIIQMKHKEHLLRMKIMKVQLKQLMHSNALLDMCKLGLQNSFDFN